MKIRQWLDQEGKTQGWMAEEIGISKPAMSANVKGKTSPSLENAVKIYQLTNAEVDYSDMLIRPVDTPAINTIL